MNPSRFGSTRTANSGGDMRSNNNVTSIGAANEDMFLKAFDSTPKIELTSKRLDNELARVISTISNQNADWDARVQAIKHFRSLVNSGIADLTDDFHTTTLKTLEIPFQNNICDLRSQVVRETCITIAFLSCRLQQKFSRMAEILLPPLIKLIPNSAKIISTSSLVALRFIIQSTHSSRFIPIIKYQLSTSKSKDIQRALCEIAERIVTLWPTSTIERQINDFIEVLRQGLCNPDEMARQSARRAFNVFAEHFREPADRLYNSLDQRFQRMLSNLNHGGGSTLSINGYGSQASNLQMTGQPSSLHHNYHYSSSTTASHSNGTSNGPSHGSASTNNNLGSRLKSTLTHTNNVGTSNGTVMYQSPSRLRTPTARSTSAIDVAAQRRARARAVYLSSIHTQARQLGQIGHQTPSKSTLNHHSVTPNNPNHVTPPATSAIPTPTSSHHYQTPTNNMSNITQPITPNIAQQQQQLQQLQQQQAASAEKKDGAALSNAASYLLSVIQNTTMAESQIVTTVKYFNSLIEKHPPEIVSQYISELMPPLVIGIDNPAICVRKASVFAMVAIHSKVGLKQMESYLTSLTMTQKKLLEVYIKKSKEGGSLTCQ